MRSRRAMYFVTYYKGDVVLGWAFLGDPIGYYFI